MGWVETWIPIITGGITLTGGIVTTVFAIGKQSGAHTAKILELERTTKENVSKISGITEKVEQCKNEILEKLIEQGQRISKLEGSILNGFSKRKKRR